MNGILAAVSQREFWSEADIKNLACREIEKSLRLYRRTADTNSTPCPDELRARLIFATPKQRTWLIASSLMAFCILDDRRREEPRVQWRAKLQEALPVVGDDTWSSEAGVLHFGKRPKGWLYSKHLFVHEPVSVALDRFLSEGAA